MKRTLLTFAMTIATFLGFQAKIDAQTTKTYTDDLVVTVDGERAEIPATTVSVEFLESGNINFLLKNFSLSEDIHVGTIEIKDLPIVRGRRFDSFLFKGDINILPGDIEGVTEDMYLGPMISPIPVKLKGKVSDEKLYVTIDIDMSASIEQVIYVTFGTDFPALSVTSTKQYTDGLVVTINEESTDPMETTVTVETLETGDINFVLKNFNLMGEINVGNIIVEELMLEEGPGYQTFLFNGYLDITAGDVEGVEEETYLGPIISPVPLELKGKISDEKLYVTIDIDMMDMLGQSIYVTFGTDLPDSYTISFEVDGETISTQQLEEGATITVPEVEERDGYTFAWIDEIPEVMPKSNVTIHGSYTSTAFTLTIKIDNEVVSQQQVDSGAAITVPEPEAREGYTFYWRDEIPATMPSEDLTINGEFVVNQYWVQLVVDGEEIYHQLQDYGSPIVVPEVEEREGYTFAWDGEIPETVPAESVLVHGNYTANIYTVTFILDGQEFAKYELEYGAEITAPEVDGDERYSFGGWEDVPATVPAHDVVIYGGMVDGVANAQRSTLNAQRTYNLAGMRVNLKHARGIIIVDGKKIFKKY